MADAPETRQRFAGFDSPHYTQVPDELFDELLVDLSGAELKVLLYIIRRTFGFKRRSDSISLRQMVTGIRGSGGKILDRGTGLAKASVIRAVKGLLDKGIIVTARNRSAEAGDEATTYAVKFKTAEKTLSQNETPPRGLTMRPPVSQKLPTQQTEQRQTDLSNSRKLARGVEHAPDDGQRKSWLGPVAEPAQGPEAKARRRRGLEPIAAALTRRVLVRPAQPEAEARSAIEAYIRDVAAEFGDRAALTSSVSRACNLYTRSGRPLPLFIDALFVAAATVRDESATIGRVKPIGNRMSYFFSVLADKLSLRAAQNPQEPRDAREEGRVPGSTPSSPPRAVGGP